MATLAELMIRLNSSTRPLTQGLRRAEGQLRRSARNIGRTADSINRSITIPFALAGAASVKMFSDVESSFNKIENLVGVTGNTLEGFKEGVKGLSEQVGKSQKELSEALFVVTSAGLRGASAMDVLEQAAKASAVGLGDTTQIARTVTSVMQAYGEANITAAQASDTLFKIVKEGNLEAESLAGSIGQVLGPAATLGITFGEVGANIATMTRLGLNAEQAVTTLKAVMQLLIKPSKEGAEALESVGLSADKLRQMVREKGLAQTLVTLKNAFGDNVEALGAVIPNVRALTNVLGTSGEQAETYIQIAKSLSETNGDVNRAFEATSQTVKQQFNVAFVKAQNAALEFGKTLAPVAIKIATAIGNIAKRITMMDEGMKRGIIRLGLFASSMGLALKASSIMIGTLASVVKGLKNMIAFVGGVTKKWAALDMAMKATTIGLVIAGIAAAVVVFASLNKALGDANAAYRTITKAQNAAQAEAEVERAKIEPLIKLYGDQAQSQENRKKALDKLRQIMPGYLDHLKDEEINVQNVTAASEEYVKSLEKQAMIRILNQELETQIKKQRELEQALEATASSFGGNIAKTPLENKLTTITDQVQKLKSEISSLVQSDVSAPGMSGGGSDEGEGAGAVTKTGGAVSGLSNAMKELSENNAMANAQFQVFGDMAALMKSRVDTLRGAIVDMLEEGINPSNNQLQLLASRYNDLKNPLAEIDTLQGKVTSGVKDFKSSLELANEQLAEHVEWVRVMTNAKINAANAEETFAEILGKSNEEASRLLAMSSGIADGFINAFDAVIEGGRSFGEFMKKMFIDLIKQAIKALIITAALKVLGGAAGTFGDIFKGVMGLKGLLQGIPSAAGGGVFKGETLARVGDYHGSNINPEVAMPIRDLGMYLKRYGAGGGEGYIAETRINVNDLLILLRRGSNNRANGGLRPIF